MWAYCYEDAVRVGRAIEALNYFWYEDPLVEEDLYNYVKLRDKMDIPIMSTEYAPGPPVRHGAMGAADGHRHPARRRGGDGAASRRWSRSPTWPRRFA